MVNQAAIYPVHTLPGRVRLQVTGLKGNRELAVQWAAAMGALPNISRASASGLTGRVLIYYDPAAWTVAGLIARLGKISQNLSAPGSDTGPRPAAAEISPLTAPGTIMRRTPGLPPCIAPAPPVRQAPRQRTTQMLIAGGVQQVAGRCIGNLESKRAGQDKERARPQGLRPERFKYAAPGACAALSSTRTQAAAPGGKLLHPRSTLKSAAIPLLTSHLAPLISEVAATAIQPDWHHLPAAAVLERLSVAPGSGLSEVEVQQRRQLWGANVLAEPARPSPWELFKKQFADVMVRVLMAASGLSLFLGRVRDAVFSLGVVTMNACLGVWQELKAGRALASLQQLAAPAALVTRAGRQRRLPASELVPGDIIHLRAGDRVPADARLLAAADLEVEEASLTGESVPARKQVKPLAGGALSPGDLDNIVFMGTSITRGRGQAVVVATGTATQMGQVADLLQEGPQLTPLQASLGELGRVLTLGCLGVSGLVLAGGLLRGRGILEMVLMGASLAVAAIPEGLPVVVALALAFGVQRLARRRVIVRRLPAMETLGCTSVICCDKTGTLTRNEMTVRAVACGGAAWQVRGTGYQPEGEFIPQGPVDMAAEGDLKHFLTLAALCCDARLIPPQGDASLHARYCQQGAAISPLEPGGRAVIAGPNGGEQGAAVACSATTAPGEEATAAGDAAAFAAGWTTGDAPAHPSGRTCTAAFPAARQDRWTVAGDPTEGALLVAAARAGLDLHRLQATYSRCREMPFNPEERCMTVLYRDREDRQVLITKGAPEVILKRCDRVRRRGRVLPLTPARRRYLEKQNETMAGQALRVLAVAYREDAAGDAPFIFSGLAGMYDPPRPEAGDAVARCRTAGIRVVMITGDHPATAAAIARELGVLTAGGMVMTGAELDQLADTELERLVPAVQVYARTSPQHKLRIVKAWQRAGGVVAMTGDGVNDAPAVKAADIGLAMGRNGTDVTRDAASLVITDDNLATIITAVEEGRSIYTNIRRAIRYLLGTNIGDVVITAGAVLAGLPLPLLPVQLLWLNLVGDSLPALALIKDPPARGIMKQQPRSRQENFFRGGFGRQIVTRGILIGLGGLGLFAWRLLSSGSVIAARSLALASLLVSQLWHLFDCRLQDGGAARPGLGSNPYLLAAGAFTAALSAVTFTSPYLQALLYTVPLTAGEWLLATAAAAAASTTALVLS